MGRARIAMKPLTVLMTTDAVGGVFSYSLELIRALQPHNVHFLLAILGPPPSKAQRDQLTALSNVRPFECHGRLEWMEDPWRDVDHHGDFLANLAARFSPDLIHVNGYSHAAIPWSAPTLCVAHSCVLSWWQAVKAEPAPAQWLTYQRRVAAGLKAANMVVAPTQAMLDDITRFYLQPAYSQVIYNARQPAAFQPQPKHNWILTAGRLWDEAKNVQALSSLAPRFPWPVFAAGHGSLPATPNFHQLGVLPQAKLAEWLSYSALYVAPALYEPFGLSILEAAHSGCALILGDIPSLRELWDKAALFVDPRDPAALLATIDLVIADENLRTCLQLAARTRAARYSPELMASQYLQAYRDLLALRRQSCAS